MYIYTYIYIYIYTCTYVHKPILMYVHVYTRMNIYPSPSMSEDCKHAGTVVSTADPAPVYSCR